MTTIEDEIDAAYEAEPPEPLRDYIGASSVGNPCEALLAYTLRGFPSTPPTPRLKRVFALGHSLEKTVLADLRRAGYRVWDKDPETGEQFGIAAFGGHVQMHADGFIGEPGWRTGEPVRLLEIKSMNDALWTKFKNKGLKTSHRRYWDQVQYMMGHGGILEAQVVAYNKNNSKYHAEIVTFDVFEFESLRATVERVMLGDAGKIASDRSDWRCKGCPKFDACWKDAHVAVSCQSCQYSVAAEDGSWFCDLNGTEALDPCGDWKRYEPKPRK